MKWNVWDSIRVGYRSWKAITVIVLISAGITLSSDESELFSVGELVGFDDPLFKYPDGFFLHELRCLQGALPRRKR